MVAEAALRRLPDLAGLRRVRTESIHLTLAFLGEVEASRLAEVVAAASASAAASAPFELSLGSPVAFAGRGRPGVLALRVERGAGEVCAVAGVLRRELEARRLPFDAKPFRAHVTLARVRGGFGPEVCEEAVAALGRSAAPIGLTVPVRQLEVIESVLSTRDARHSTRAALRLAGQIS